MPLKWEPGRNPYREHYFARLRLGPNASQTQIVGQAHQLKQRITAGAQVAIGDLVLDEHAISEASAKLREPEALAEELLLAHPQPKDDRKRLRNLIDPLRHAAAITPDFAPLSLRHPLALFWFLDPPGLEAVPPPDSSEFGLAQPGDESDQALDIVFDH